MHTVLEIIPVLLKLQFLIRFYANAIKINRESMLKIHKRVSWRCFSYVCIDKEE